MPRTDRASRVIAAPPERVWAALVDPEALMAWPARVPPGILATHQAGGRMAAG